MTGATPPGRAWDVRAYEPGDEHGLLRLWADAFGARRTLEAWRWKFRARADAPMVWVAQTRDGEIVGHYGGLPVGVFASGARLRSVHAVEAMTAPAYRRQGILTALGSAAHAAWRDAGYAAVIGLPNDRWVGPAARLGYRHATSLSWLRFPLRLDRVLASRLPGSRALLAPVLAPATIASRIWARRLGPRPRDIAVARTEDTSRLDGSISVRPADDRVATVARDAASLAWRFVEPTHLAYTLLAATRGSDPVGYLAYRLAPSRSGRTGYIADLRARPRDRAAMVALVHAAFDALACAGAATVATAINTDSPLGGALLESGFRRTDADLAFQVVALANEASGLESARWQLMGGDFDIDLGEMAADGG